jgi:4-diphosphocytidyl-2-C-methyl-D-erythritol kinase
VPVAAGLGGGSADAACALRLVAAAAGHRGPDADAQLLDLAAELGSDVPAMMDPGRWLVRGTGERLLRLPDPGDELAVLVVPSAARLSTAAVYRECDRLDAPRPAGELAAHADAILEALSDATALPPVDLLANDLEGAARSLCPSVDEALGGVRASAPDATMVSGSGPTVVGLFVGAGSRRRAQRAADGLGGLRPAVVVATAVGNGFGHPAAIDSA